MGFVLPGEYYETRGIFIDTFISSTPTVRWAAAATDESRKKNKKLKEYVIKRYTE